MPTTLSRKSRKKNHQVTDGIELNKNQRLVISLLMLPCLWVAYCSVTFLIALLNNFQTESWLSFWQDKANHNVRFVLNENEFNTALTSAFSAMHKQPENKLYVKNVADVYQWFALNGDKNSSQFKTAKENAFKYYREAIRLNPHSPHVWMDLAEAKIRFGKLDREFDDAYLKALELGPWDERTQSRAAVLGFRLFYGVITEVRVQIKENWRRMYQHQKYRFLDFLELFQGYKKACPSLTPPLPKKCDSVR